MAVEFDHLFICTACGSEEEASCLVAFGLTEGTPNLHPGQGTACRRFFFANGYLELLWVCDAKATQSEPARRTHLWDRWKHRTRGACPFGLGLRPKAQQAGSVPFRSWEYRPAYLPGPLSIQVANNAHMLSEPMLFHLPFAQRPDAYSTAKRQPLQHRAGLRELTRVEFTSPYADRLSPEIKAVTGAGLACLRVGSEYLVELGFDGESAGRKADFRPVLRLLFSW